MKKYIVALLTFMSIFVLSACDVGGGSSANSIVPGAENKPSVFLVNIKKIRTDINGKNFTLSLHLVKNENGNYLIELSNLNLEVKGCTIDVSTLRFDPSKVILDGNALSRKDVFVYGQFLPSCRDASAKDYYFSADMRISINGKAKVSRLIISSASSNGGGNVPADGYAFINASTPLLITQASMQYEIKVQLIKDSFIASGNEVTLRPFDLIFGSVSIFTVTTGIDGYARFKYTSPQTLAIGTQSDPLTIVYRDENNATIEQEIILKFESGTQPVVPPVDTKGMLLVAVPQVINISTPNEISIIRLHLSNTNGDIIPDIDIRASFFDPNRGRLDAYTTTTNASGIAVFSYIAPALLPASGINITFDVASATVSISKDVTLTFNRVADANKSVPIVVVANNLKNITLTQNNQNVQMEVQVFEQASNTPYVDGNVKVSLPDEVLVGTDVGSFTEYTVPVGPNGKAVFNYTGPQNLQLLINNGNLNAIFKFFHEGNPTQQEEITVTYDLQADYIPVNYMLTTSSSDESQTMGLESSKAFAMQLRNMGELVDNAYINSIRITSQNAPIGQLIDENNAGANVSTMIFTGVAAINGKSFSIQTYRLSGLLPIEITMAFTDPNGASRILTTTMNVVVFSGPPTALSISYAGVEQNLATAKYIEKFAVTVTDSYNNPVNMRPFIATGAIVEYAVNGSSLTGERNTTSPRLWHGILDQRGELEALGNTARFTTGPNDVFNHVDINNDRLVVFGAGFAFEAFGKWDLASISPQLLGLKDNYFGKTRPNVLFAVGHNNRQDLCAVDARQYVGNMQAINYQLDRNGHALLEFAYDYHLTGKDIMVWVNLTGFQADNANMGRIGDAQKHTLRGAGFMTRDSYTLPTGIVSGSYRFRVRHAEAPEWYRNGHFAFAITGKCRVHNIIDWSNHHDARVCTNTIGYVDLNVSNPSAGDCTITLDGIAVSPEFYGASIFR